MATRGDSEKRPFSSGHTERAWETLVYPCSYIRPSLPARQQVCAHEGEMLKNPSLLLLMTPLTPPPMLEYFFRTIKSEMQTSMTSLSVL